MEKKKIPVLAFYKLSWEYAKGFAVDILMICYC